MKVETRLFSTIDIAEDKIITMEKGMIGFPDLKHFSLIFDEEKKSKSFKIMWLQSMDDGDIAFPVVDPSFIQDDYQPFVNEEILTPLGNMNETNTYMLVTATVPKKIEDFSVNLKAPIVINTDTNKGAQVIAENDYSVKHKIYNLLKNKKAGE